jgi:hemolysin activation/secretion protein
MKRISMAAPPWVRALVALWLFSASLQGQVLPPAPEQPDPEPRLSTQARIFVRAFQFEGNSAFSHAELEALTAPFVQRELTTDDLEQARRAVTLHYVNQGYLNSGAILPDQDPSDGVILMRIIEGHLTQIHLSGNRWLSDRYLYPRLRRYAQSPLNLNQLQDGLQWLRLNPNITQINAELQPGDAPGEAHLDLHIADRQPFRVGLQFDNQRPPSVGAEQLSLLASILNVTGHSDSLELRYGIAHAGVDGPEFSEFDNVDASYRLPITRYDTTLGFYGSRLNSSIVESTFQPLDIESLSTSFGLLLHQPVLQSVDQEISLTLAFDRRENETRLLAEPFSLSPGAVDGKTAVSVLRFSQEWIGRGQDHVLAIRSTFNLGLDLWDATDSNIPGEPNATFFSWLAQAQYVRRLFHTQNQLVWRLTGQWTQEPLLALEQISLGGFDTIRGYVENQLVRDRGLSSSVELRLPVWFNSAGAGMLFVAPFFDIGVASGVQHSPGPTTLCSTGAGLLLTPNRHLSAQLYWGYRLRDVDMPDDAGLQGHGISFKIQLLTQ